MNLDPDRIVELVLQPLRGQGPAEERRLEPRDHGLSSHRQPGIVGDGPDKVEYQPDHSVAAKRNRGRAKRREHAQDRAHYRGTSENGAVTLLGDLIEDERDGEEDAHWNAPRRYQVQLRVNPACRSGPGE
ncbi:MAG: hypothetical protein H0T93_04840 [Chloroflexia bacterium]|nr:hypothetical protein [Chloroflexia bacterium]